MSDTGGLIVYKIIGWKITTMEIKGGARAPGIPPWIRPCLSHVTSLVVRSCLRWCFAVCMCVQMKKLTETFMKIFKLKKPFGLHGLYKNISAL